MTNTVHLLETVIEPYDCDVCGTHGQVILFFSGQICKECYSEAIMSAAKAAHKAKKYHNAVMSGYRREGD